MGHGIHATSEDAISEEEKVGCRPVSKAVEEEEEGIKIEWRRSL